ncbi:MAG: S8 family serine peptidase, partial [Calditrichae bacterium]|nr:S8 family serine peptidase [Calditrichia bacterium]
MQNKADNTQGPVQQFLTSKSAEEVNEVQSFWITNMLLVEALPVVFYELSTRQDIDFMDLAGQIVLDKPVEKGPVTKSIQNNAEPGLRAIKAHLMWRMGFTGQGRLVMNIDSGVNGNHRALSDRWRGNHVPSNHAWYGAGTFPSDCDNLNNHGTHTMGTMAGRDPITFDTIGVAPDAEWIAAGTVGCGGSTVGAFQWALNPDGDPNTIVDMPDAIGNSWRDPGGGDCASNIYQSSINAL